MAPDSEWQEVVDGVFAGVAHTLNNRAASLQASAELGEGAGRDAGNGREWRAVAADAQRVLECARVCELMAESQDSREEALAVADVLDDALMIHRLAQGMGRPVRVDVDTGAGAVVRATRWKMLRGLIMVIAEAKRCVAETTALKVTLGSSDDAVLLAVTGMGTTGVAPSGRTYSDRLFESLGGSVSRSDVRIEVRLPSLSSRRSSDRR